jgi:hypothetical protein
MRILGRRMRMLTIPNQSSVAKAFLEFDEAGRMKPSAYHDRVVDMMAKLLKFTLLTRCGAVSGRPLQRAQGRCERTLQAGQSEKHLSLEPFRCRIVGLDSR